MIPATVLIRLLDHLVGNRLRNQGDSEAVHGTIREIATDSGCDIQDVATLYRIACGEGYDVADQRSAPDVQPMRAPHVSEPTWGFLPSFLFTDEEIVDWNRRSALIRKADRGWLVANPIPPFGEFNIPKSTTGEEIP